MTTEPQPVDSLSYEEAVRELEAVVAALESNQHTLDEALQLFERGQALLQHCTSLLDQAELRVRRILSPEGGE